MVPCPLFLKRPSHNKLMLANFCWQIQIGVFEQHNISANCWRKVARIDTSSIFRQRVAVSYTHTNLSLPTQVGNPLSVIMTLVHLFSCFLFVCLLFSFQLLEYLLCPLFG